MKIELTKEQISKIQKELDTQKDEVTQLIIKKRTEFVHEFKIDNLSHRNHKLQGIISSKEIDTENYI